MVGLDYKSPGGVNSSCLPGTNSEELFCLISEQIAGLFLSVQQDTCNLQGIERE
jgi:hypothetical protein